MSLKGVMTHKKVSYNPGLNPTEGQNTDHTSTNNPAWFHCTKICNVWWSWATSNPDQGVWYHVTLFST